MNKNFLLLIFLCLAVIFLLPMCEDSGSSGSGDDDDDGGEGADGDTVPQLFLIENLTYSTYTEYFSLAGWERKLTEAEVRFPFLRDGTISNFTFKCTFNTLTASYTATIRKNGTDTAIYITIPAGTTGTFTDPDTVEFLAADEFSIESDASASIGAAEIDFIIGFILSNRNN